MRTHTEFDEIGRELARAAGDPGNPWGNQVLLVRATSSNLDGILLGLAWRGYDYQPPVVTHRIVTQRDKNTEETYRYLIIATRKAASVAA